MRAFERTMRPLDGDEDAGAPMQGPAPPPVALLPAQCRAARGLLDITQSELADRTGISLNSIRRFEAGRDLSPKLVALIRVALERQGIEFLGPDAESVGVRLQAPRSDP